VIADRPLREVLLAYVDRVVVPRALAQYRHDHLVWALWEPDRDEQYRGKPPVPPDFLT
jgi:hypothetical protein